jgi:hypothetical protein
MDQLWGQFATPTRNVAIELMKLVKKVNGTNYSPKEEIHGISILYNLTKYLYYSCSWSRDSLVGIAADYGLDGRGAGVRVPLGSRIFYSPRRPDRLWVHPASYPLDSGG